MVTTTFWVVTPCSLVEVYSYFVGRYCLNFMVKMFAKQELSKNVRFEVLTAVIMMSSAFCDITPCRPIKDNRCFGGTCRLQLQGWKVSRASNKQEACSKRNIGLLASCWLLSGLLSDPEDGSDTFL
jgi:hypothetical protein